MLVPELDVTLLGTSVQFYSEVLGFRVLFVANTLERAVVLRRLAEEMAPMDFVWTTDHGRLRGSGLHGAIWQRGGRAGVADQSVLGSVASCVGAPPSVEQQRT